MQAGHYRFHAKPVSMRTTRQHHVVSKFHNTNVLPVHGGVLTQAMKKAQRLLCQQACSPVLRHQVHALVRLPGYVHSVLEEAEYLQ